MTYARMSDPARGKRHFPIDDATQRRKDRGRRQSVWVVCRSRLGGVAVERQPSSPVLVCASHGAACKKVRELRKVDPSAAFTATEVPLFKVDH